MLSDLQLLTDSASDLNWLKENIKSVKEKFEGEILAIKNKEIVAFAPTVEILFRKLKEKGIEESEVIIQYVSSNNEVVIL